MTFKFRLLPTVLFCMGALVLVSAGSMLALNLFTTTTVATDLVTRLVAQNLKGLELAVRGHLNPARSEATFIADRLRTGELNFTDREKLGVFVEGSLAAAPQIGALLITDAEGNTLRVVRTSSGEVEQNWRPLTGNALRAATAQQRANRKEAFWGRPIYSQQLNQTILNLRMPVWRDDTYVGLVGVGITTESLSELALGLSNPPHSTVFVLNSNGDILAHKYLTEQTPQLSADHPLLEPDEVNDPVIAGLGEAETVGEEGGGLASLANVSAVEANGVRYLAITKPVRGYGREPIVIGAYSIASEVNTPFRMISHAMMIGVGLFVAAMILAFVMSRMITKPVRRTSASTTAIAALDFDGVAPLPRSRIREMDDLANSFNAMLVGLKSFERYVPRSLVKRLMRENRVGAGTEERELTVLFTDIVGFTAICEGQSPSEVAEFINDHLTLVSECIEHEGGTIDKYIGDAVMAFWGAPDQVDDAPMRAARAAMEIRRRLAEDNDTRVEMGLMPVRIRIGIHTGALIVGDIGAPSRLNYTVVGDVVNATQRLEALGKEIGPDAESIVLVSDATRNGLDDTFELVNVGRFKVKGKQQEIEVFRLVCQLDPDAETPEAPHRRELPRKSPFEASAGEKV